MKKYILALGLGGSILAAVTLTGCSAATGSTAPAPSSSSNAAELPEKDVACNDGVARVTDDSAKITIDGDCATVEIVASNSTVTVTGAVENVKVQGAINLVTAKTIGSVTISEGSNGNTVQSSNEPAIDDKGDQNDFSRTK